MFWGLLILYYSIDGQISTLKHSGTELKKNIWFHMWNEISKKLIKISNFDTEWGFFKS